MKVTVKKPSPRHHLLSFKKQTLKEYCWSKGIKKRKQKGIS